MCNYHSSSSWLAVRTRQGPPWYRRERPQTAFLAGVQGPLGNLESPKGPAGKEGGG